MIYHSDGSGGNIKAGTAMLKGIVITATVGAAVDIEVYDDLLAAANKKFQLNCLAGDTVVVMLPEAEKMDAGISVVFAGTGFWSVIWR